MQLSQKRKYFFNFLLHFLHLNSILSIFKKKSTSQLMHFLSYGLPKTWWDKCLKNLFHIYWSLWTQFSRKKSLLVICKILGLFVNPFSANDKYSLLNRGSLLQHFQIQLSKKRKIFFQFVFAFSKFRFDFEHLQKIDDPHSWCIFELRYS